MTTESRCQNPNHDCYENNTTSKSFCPVRDTCELYDIHLDHDRLDSMFWSFILAHQGEEFHTVRQLAFTYQVTSGSVGSDDHELLTISRAKNPYTKSAVLGGLGREVGEEYYGRTYIAPLVDKFLCEVEGAG